MSMPPSPYTWISQRKWSGVNTLDTNTAKKETANTKPSAQGGGPQTQSEQPVSRRDPMLRHTSVFHRTREYCQSAWTDASCLKKGSTAFISD